MTPLPLVRVPLFHLVNMPTPWDVEKPRLVAAVIQAWGSRGRLPELVLSFVSRSQSQDTFAKRIRQQENNGKLSRDEVRFLLGLLPPPGQPAPLEPAPLPPLPDLSSGKGMLDSQGRFVGLAPPVKRAKDFRLGKQRRKRNPLDG